MALRLKATKGKAVFEYEEDGMTASWTISDQDSGPDLIKKTERMLAFLRQRILGEAPVPPVPPRGVGHHVDLPADVAVPAAPPVPMTKPPALEADVERALSTGWELYTGEEDD